MDTGGDTIAGIATPPGRSRVGVLRVSGPRALDFLQERFVPAGGGRVRGRFHWYEGVVRCVASLPPVPCRVFVMRAPRSYTREDVVEFHLPGSPVLLDMFLGECGRCGIRRAEPGEFTRRAFLNGRIDLLEAAGVMDVIAASDARRLDAARRFCFGGVSAALERFSDRVRSLSARVEAAIDFSDQDIEVISPAEWKEELDALVRGMEEVAAAHPASRDDTGEFHLVIAGMVNAGKSTLFNLLVGEERCRVSPEPGTTRDMVARRVRIEGYPFVLYDSAGISLRSDALEEAARRIFRNTVSSGMGMLLAVSPEMDLPDRLVEFFLAQPGPSRTIVVGTKDDLGLENRTLAHPAFAGAFAVVRVSREDSRSTAELKKLMAALAASGAAEGTWSAAGFLAETIASCVETLRRMRDDPSWVMHPELAAEDLRDVRRRLDVFRGDDADEDMLDRIFSRFCIGK